MTVHVVKIVHHLLKKNYNNLNISSLLTTNYSKYANIDVIKKNPASAYFEIRNIRNVNSNFCRKVTRMKKKERLDQLDQTAKNEANKYLI